MSPDDFQSGIDPVMLNLISAEWPGNRSMHFPFRGVRGLSLRARRLVFESLERRDLLSVARVVAWNTANQPNDGPSEADFQTILAAIGNETVVGNTKRLDILALQETDPPGDGGDSIGRIEGILETLYAGTDYASVVSTEDDGGDSTGFVYDTSTVSLLEAIEVFPTMLTHHVLRGKFRPDGTLGESDFYVYSVHLKSGDSGSDATQRGVEAQLLRDDADLLGESAHVLMVGDFNMKGSSEDAFANLTSTGGGQLQDVAAAPGEWFDDASFRSLHTQDPGGNLDDRFDLHFASGEFFDEVGLDYVDGSFHVFGNDGTHNLNGSITTGTGATPAVLTALANASDHLPVVADYEIIPSTPFVRIRETGGLTQAIEGGLFDTYSVVLDTVPTENVTVTITPNSQIDVGAGAGVAAQLLFTPANALTPRNVLVTAADDVADEGNHSGLVSHGSTSSDLDYDFLVIDDVNVALVDNDDPTIVINEIDSDTDGVDMLEFVELYDGGVGNVSLDAMALVFFNGNDDEAYRVFDLTGSSTDANGFFVVGNTGIAASDITFANSGLQNGADAVALYEGGFSTNDPVTTTNLLDAIVYDTNDADDPGLLVLLAAAQPQVNENENSNMEFDSLSRVPDHGTPRETSTYVAQTPTPDALNAPPLPAVLFAHSGTRVDVEENGITDSYQLSLATIPTHDVTITVDPDEQADLGAGAGVSIVLTFTTANAIVPQTINVAAVDDLLAEGDHTALIAHAAASIDSSYSGLSIANVVASVVDDEVVVPPSLVISEIMYNPDTSEVGATSPEWIEFVNTGASAVDLQGWLFNDEDGENWGALPAGTILEPGQLAVIFDSDFTDEATFRSEWSVPANALVVGVAWGSLNNDPSGMGDEALQLLDNIGAQLDLVDYDNSNPWPSINDIDGPSIYLLDPATDNNVAGNWAKAVVGVDQSVSASGPTFSTSDVGSPGYLPESADFNFDGQISGFDFLAWQRGFGMASPAALRSDGDADSDLDVDHDDLSTWENAYGNVSALAASATGEALTFSGSDVILSLPAPMENEPLAAVREQAFGPVLTADVVDLVLDRVAVAAKSPLESGGITTLAADDATGEAATDEALASWHELTDDRAFGSLPTGV